MIFPQDAIDLMLVVMVTNMAREQKSKKCGPYVPLEEFRNFHAIGFVGISWPSTCSKLSPHIELEKMKIR